MVEPGGGEALEGDADELAASADAGLGEELLCLRTTLPTPAVKAVTVAADVEGRFPEWWSDRKIAGADRKIENR